MKHFYIIILLITLFHSSFLKNHHYQNELIIWNVGQGQWITFVKNFECLHFDFGGDLKNYKKNKNLLKLKCKNKLNKLFLSHADQDHYRYLPQIKKELTEICWADLNSNEIDKMAIKDCLINKNLDKQIQILYKTKKNIKKNENSTVYLTNQVLIPGDSFKKQEYEWASQINSKKNLIKYFILSHHGSKTSNSEYLLKHLSKTQMAFVQSRYKKYKHPHYSVVERFTQFKIPLIKTEDWGLIQIGL